MKKKIYSRPISDCMVIALNEVLMVSPPPPSGGAPGMVDPENLL